jgi:predicted MFS family arabinose efflux permease
LGDVEALPGASHFSVRYRRYVLLILAFGYVVNAMDREALSVVLQAVKGEFRVTDTQLGMLGGVAFALFYAVAGIPIAAWADRTNRRNLLALAVAFWSSMTALCGVAWNFSTLLLARVGTAVGEAGGSPPSHSMISDYFPAAQRGTALAIYALGIPIGNMLGELITGWVNQYFGWRIAFYVIALPGIAVVALLMFTVKEPPRGHVDGVKRAAAGENAPRILDALRYLAACNSYRHLVLATALSCMSLASGAIWNATFFIRTYGMKTGTVGSWLALFSAIAGIGTFFGGYIADRVSARTGNQRWYMWLPGFVVLGIVPLRFCAYLSTQFFTAIPCFGLLALLSFAFYGPTFALAQSLATLRVRAIAVSVLLFAWAGVGVALGPLFVGFVSDRIAPIAGTRSLAYGLVAIGLLNVWAAVHFFRGSRSLRADIATAVASN